MKNVLCPKCGANLMVDMYPGRTRLVSCPKCRFSWEEKG